MDDPTSNPPPMRPRIVDAPNRPLAYARAADPRLRKSGWARFSMAFRRWARDTFSRESLVSSVKSLMWVAPLTVLIWIYAEREQVAKMTLPPFEVEVKSADPRKVVTILNPPDGMLSADVNGPRARLESIRDALDPRSNAAPVRIEVRADLAPGRHQIDPAGIARDPRFDAAGITVTATTPRVLDVRVQELVDDEATVDVPPDVRDRLAFAPTFVPAKVRVTAPREVIEAGKKDGGPLVVYARLDNLLDAPGPHADVPVQIDAPFGDDRGKHVTLGAGTVRATFNVKSAAEDRQPNVYMPLWATGAPSVLAEYKVEFKLDTLSNITVVGPKEQLKQLDDTSRPSPVATVRVGRDDVGEEFHKKPIDAFIGLPNGVRVVPEDQRRQVEVRLVKKAGE